MVPLIDLSLETRKFLDDLMVDYLFKPLDDWIPVERACYLVFFLKSLPDDQRKNFPRGKWATIQYLEGLIEEQMKLIIDTV